VKGRIGGDRRKSQQFEQARDTIVQGAIDALQNIVKTFHLLKPDKPTPV
jgi:hypothetical protein